MKRLLAQGDLEAMMTSVKPLLPLVSRKSCEAATSVLAGLLAEALEAQEAASKRTDELKVMKPEGLMELFTPEKRNEAAEEKKQKEKEKLQEKQVPPVRVKKPQKQVQGEEGAGAAPVSPKKKAETPKKRARKVTEKAAEAEDSDEEVELPKKQGKNGDKKKESIKKGGLWNGEEYPRIVAVIKCDDGVDGVRVKVHAKKQGRGQWQKMLFSLDSAQLDSIDRLPEKTMHLVKGSFRKALTAQYGQEWPNALRLALAGTTWAKDILPATGGGGLDGDFAGLESLASVNLSGDV